VNGKGIYHNGITAQPFDCELALHEDSLYLYLQDEHKSLRIWSFGSLDSVHLKGSTLII
jgi:hypothetical protein